MTEILAQLVEALDAGWVRVIDLTQPLGPETPVIGLPPQFAASPGVSVEVLSRYDERGPAWYWNAIHLGEHTGTHFDAPIHWITGKDLPDNACDTIPARRFVGPACVLDVAADVAADADFLLTRERVLAWEAEHGRIPPRSWVLVRSGWSRRVDLRGAPGQAGEGDFLNVAADGPHSPGFHRGAVELLAHERDVLGVGVETVGTDAGQAFAFDPPFPCHTLMHGAGRFGLASLRNLDQLPPTGAVVIAAPLKLVGGSGSPLRVIALAPAPAPVSEPASE
ncbi:MAG TPA: cyclase family protein [Thermoanaerobaculia bacterium]|nr:cyclase family protein [Thermoanaerobaculia bacterium]